MKRFSSRASEIRLRSKMEFRMEWRSDIRRITGIICQGVLVVYLPTTGCIVIKICINSASFKQIFQFYGGFHTLPCKLQLAITKICFYCHCREKCPGMKINSALQGTACQAGQLPVLLGGILVFPEVGCDWTLLFLLSCLPWGVSCCCVPLWQWRGHCAASCAQLCSPCPHTIHFN